MRNMFFAILAVGCCVFVGCGREPVSSLTAAAADKPAVNAQAATNEAVSPGTAKPPTPLGRAEGPLEDLETRKMGDDWPRFLGPHGDSKSRETGIITDWTHGLKIVWQKPLGLSYGMPTISQGRLFQLDGLPGKSRLYCLESETGKELWRFDYKIDYEDLLGYDNGPRSSPVVDGDRVYIPGVEGMLHCLDVRDGSVIWKIDTAEKFHVVQNFFGVGSTPVVDVDLLISQMGGSSPETDRTPSMRLDLVKGNGSGIVAFDKYTGEVKYKITDELASYSSPVLATIGGRRWCFVFARGGLVGFEPQTGKMDFHYPWRAKVLESVNASTPVVVGDEVFISETYGPGSSLLRVRPGGYDVVWKDPANIRLPKSMQTHWNTPVYVDGVLYGSSGRHTPDAELRAIEWKTGKVRWSEPGLSRSSLLYADGHLICLTEYGDLILLRANPNKYDEVARTRLVDATSQGELLRYPCWAAPILSHGLLYVRGKDRLVCVELIKN